jgi:hypothetical protein
MPRLHQTTVRFNAESWEQVGIHSARLGVPRATFIREATQARIARGDARDEIRQLCERVDRLEATVTRALRARQRRP